MENALSEKIIGSCIEVHRILGPGLLESIYESALCHELKLSGLNIRRQVAVPVKYKDSIIRDPLQIDVLVNECVIVEIKATDKNIPLYKSQLLTYLRLTDKKLGLLVNFGYERVFSGITRVVNGLES